MVAELNAVAKDEYELTRIGLDQRRKVDGCKSAWQSENDEEQRNHCY